MRALQYGLGIILLMSSAIAHSADDAFVHWAAAHAIPVKTLDSGGDFQDLLPLKSMIGTARVVSLGENIHGAHEPMAFRNLLFRFLVEQMGFTAIALESGFMESRLVDSYVSGGPGDAQTVTREGLTSGFGEMDENRELIQWMRDYNVTASRQGHRKIHFYGIDMNGGSGRLGGARRTIDYALAYLSRADTIAAEKIRSSLGNSLPAFDDDEDGALSAPVLAKFDEAIAAIARAMNLDRANLIARSSHEEYRWALHNLDVARQLSNYYRLAPKSMNIRDQGPQGGARDFAMAQNVQWIVENEGPQGRILVYAHDGHVMNWRIDGGIWAVVRDKPLMMGSYLRSVYGTDLFIIATSSATASAELPPLEPMKDSIDSALARVGLPAMILDIRMAQADQEALEWLSRPRPLHANLSTYGLITPSTALDAFFFVNRLTPGRSVPLSGRLLNELDHYWESVRKLW